jgi:hypothetical protein
MTLDNLLLVLASLSLSAAICYVSIEALWKLSQPKK